MGILFDANGEYINHGSAAGIDDLATLTVAIWHYPTTVDGSYRHIIGKSDDGTHGWGIQTTNWWDASNPNTLQIYRSTNNGGDYQLAGGSDNMLTLNAWNFDAGYIPAVGTAPSLYHGNLTTIVADVTEQDTFAGSGAADSDAAYSLYLGAVESDTNSGYRGTIGFIAVWDGQISLANLRIVQFHPLSAVGVGTCVFMVYPGLDGGSTVYDKSGNTNDGTVTNATLSTVHLPLGPYFGRNTGLPYVVAAAGAPPTGNLWGPLGGCLRGVA